MKSVIAAPGVKTQRAYETIADDEIFDSLINEIQFDEQGRVIEEVEYQGEDHVMSTSKNFYNEAGQLVKNEQVDGIDWKSISQYKYNKKGLITREVRNTQHDGEKTKSEIVYAYDKDGDLLSKHEDGEILVSVIKNPEQNKVTELIFEGNTVQMKTTRVSFNGGKYVYEKTKLYYLDALSDARLDIYDDNNRLVKSALTGGDDYDIYKYDKAGNIKQIDCYFDNYLYRVVKYKYTYWK